ncbi:MAG TPA: hypothetical protein VJ728_10340, partial [Candidatus Binataceae bacterium]|nr:hypothetical protein [Candidatus Binataceae bacterium]
SPATWRRQAGLNCNAHIEMSQGLGRDRNSIGSRDRATMNNQDGETTKQLLKYAWTGALNSADRIGGQVVQRLDELLVIGDCAISSMSGYGKQHHGRSREKSQA